MMKTNKNTLRIVAISLLLSIGCFIIDYNESVQTISTIIFEIFMMAGILYGIISIVSMCLKYITYKLRRPTT